MLISLVFMWNEDLGGIVMDYLWYDTLLQVYLNVTLTKFSHLKRLFDH